MLDGMLVETVGIVLGRYDGHTVGQSVLLEVVGRYDGRNVGIYVGTLLGFLDGLTVGCREGFRDDDGDIVEGFHVGSGVGEIVG